MTNSQDQDSLRTIAQLLQKLVDHIEHDNFGHTMEYLTNDLVLLHGRSLFVNGKVLTLSKRERILLELLVDHALATGHSAASQYLARNLLLAAIEKKYDSLWQAPISGDVDKAVASLRAKFAKKGISRDLIETVKNVGLRLSTPPKYISRGDSAAQS